MQCERASAKALSAVVRLLSCPATMSADPPQSWNELLMSTKQLIYHIARTVRERELKPDTDAMPPL